MQEIDAIKLALRVLEALTYKREPDWVDVAALRQYADAEFGDLAGDELACEVIQTLVNRHSGAAPILGQEQRAAR